MGTNKKMCCLMIALKVQCCPPQLLRSTFNPLKRTLISLSQILKSLIDNAGFWPLVLNMLTLFVLSLMN